MMTSGERIDERQSSPAARQSRKGWLALLTRPPRPVFRGGPAVDADAAVLIPFELEEYNPFSGHGRLGEPRELPVDRAPAIDARREARALRARLHDAAESEAQLLELLRSFSGAMQRVRAGDYSVRLGRGPAAPAGEGSEMAQQFDSFVENLESTVALNARFQSMAAHDMRSPLATIELALSALRGMCKQPDQQRLVELIQSAARRQLRLVESVLDAYALQSGHFQIDRRSVDVNELLRQSVQALETQARSHQQTLTITEFAADAGANCDSGKIYRVLDNLLVNAIKYSVRGDTIELSCVEEPDGQLRVQVLDHGPGLAPPEIATLFDCYRRGAHAANIQGTGLGLAICKEIIQAHGGRLWVESELGKGCRFVFTIPRDAYTAGE